MVMHVFIGETKPTSQNHDLFMYSLRTIFIIFSVLCFVGIFASLARGKKEVAQ